MAPVTLTFTSHPASSQTINAAVSGLRAQLPLRNLHWKPSTRTSLRTIQEVDVELVELGDVPTGARSGLGSVLDQPLVNICLVVCEDSETYKNSTKSFIRDWLSLLSSRRSATTPLIVLVNPPTSVAASGKNVFGRDKGVLGKLKSDFNTGKRDRCVQVNLPPEGRDDPAAWPEVMNKIKESVVLAFDTAIVEREEEVKRGEAQRMMVGWNFCTWFLLKESLAHSFEAVGLPSDALVIYEELEATFFQILKEQNLSWFGKLGATAPRDDSLPVLDVKNKPYREMLQGSAISIFDFRIYVFARQASLLGQLGRITEVAKRGQWFVASLTRRLKESEADLAEQFIESWTYTASMDIVQKCDEWSRIDRPNGDYSGLVAYESARSELLDIARVQVERLGVAAGHLPNAYPFAAAAALLEPTDDVLFESSETGSNPDQGDVEPYKRGDISNTELIEAKMDVTKFRAFYTSLTKKAILAYEACGKINSVIRLKTDLAALALINKDWEAAYVQCCALAKDCAEQSVWAPVARFALDGALQSHGELQWPKDTEWAFLAMAYLRICATFQDEQNQQSPGAIERVLLGLEDCKGEANANDHEAFELAVESTGTTSADTADAISLTVTVVNKLPTRVCITDFELTATAGEGNQVQLRQTSATLQPGRNTVSLACRSLVQGLYTVDRARFKLGQVSMSFTAQIQGSELLMRRPAGCPTAVVRMPHDIALDRDPVVVVEVQAKDVAMTDAHVRLVSNDPSIYYDLDSAVSGGKALKSSDSGHVIGSLDASGHREIIVPYAGTPHGDAASAYLLISYTAADGQITEWAETFHLNMGLPLTVNVQDFFRPDCLISQFTIAADGRESLKIASIDLSPPESGHTVESGRMQDNEPVVVTPAQPLSRIYKIRRSGQGDASTAAVLRLVIRYITVEDEVSAAVQRAMPPSASESLRRRIKKRIQGQADWSDRYLLHGWQAVFDKVWEDEASTVGNAADADALSLLLERLQGQQFQPTWRTLEIPVDVPSRRLLTSVEVKHDSTPESTGRLYEGRAIALTVRMRTTFAWAGEAWRQAKMVYDVLPLPEDWLVLGKKKGFFTLTEDGGSHETEIVLVPMRPGHLFLPNVVVSLLHPEAEGADGLMSETHVENAAEALEILPAKGGGVAFIPLEPSWGVDAERRL